MLINDGLIDVKLEERLTIRKMEHFLLELYNCLKYNYKHILKETTIAFFLLSIFFRNHTKYLLLMYH